MRQANPYLLWFVNVVVFPLFVVSATQAGPVAGPWNNATGVGNGPIWNDDTDHPIVGDLVVDPNLSSNLADNEMFDSPFPSITLANPSDRIVLTGAVALDGTINSPSTSSIPRNQFRFGLFNGDETGSDDNGWVGYYMSNRHGVAGSPFGVLARKPVGNTSPYLSGIGQNIMTSVPGDGTNASLFNDDTFTMRLTIERNAGGELIVSGTLTGLNGYSQMLSHVDSTASISGTYTFDHVGFYLGVNLDTDRAAFSQLDVTFTPGSGFTSDYNDDGTVDAADYVVWRKGLTPFDYEAWHAHFGESIEHGDGARSPIPEPASMLLLISGAAAAVLLLRLRRDSSQVSASAHC